MTAGTRIYSRFLRLYPRGFREEYGPDMELLFSEQLRDEPAGRVCARSIIDLATTVPVQHLEVHMNRTPSPIVALWIAAVSMTAISIAIVGGTNRAVLAVALPVAVVSAVLAVLLRRSTRSMPGSHQATAHRWKYLVGGSSLLIGVLGITTVTGEVSESMWLPTMAAIAFALVLLATGVVLTVVHLAAGRAPHATS